MSKEIILFMKNFVMHIHSSWSLLSDAIYKCALIVFAFNFAILPLLTTAVMDTCIIAKISRVNEYNDPFISLSWIIYALRVSTVH